MSNYEFSLRQEVLLEKGAELDRIETQFDFARKFYAGIEA